MTERKIAGLFRWPLTPEQGPAAGQIVVLGVPSDFGNAYVSGARLGPAAIRRASLDLPQPPIAGVDIGDIDVFGGHDWVDIIAVVRDAVERIACSDALPLVLGGDHAVSYAAVSALHRFGPLDIVWFDAHTDFCPWDDTEWHNHKQVLRRIAALPHVAKLLVVGHRGITYFDESTQSPDLDVVGVDASSRIPEAWLAGERPVYLSIDIDALDPCVAPGTGHPVPGGLDIATLSNMIRKLACHRTIVGADLMEVNPALDHDGMTSAAAAQLLWVLISHIRLTHAQANEGVSV